MKKNPLGVLYVMIALFYCGGLRCQEPPKVLSLASKTIGTWQYVWEDTSRIDAYYGGERIINVQVWYPGEESALEYARTHYLLFEDKLFKKLNGWTAQDFATANKIQTNSRIHAPISNELTRAPLLIFSPSLGGNISYYTYYAEYFAAHGYVVMGINHLYESEAIVDLNGSIYPADFKFHDSLKSLKIPEEITADGYREAMGARQKVLAEDMLFALNSLLSERPIGNKIDQNKIGVFGHSMGGAAAIYAALLDNRIKSVIDLDGTPPTLALEYGIDVPFLFIEDLTDYRNHTGYAKMHERRSLFCERNKSDSWRVLIHGFNHNSFLDINYYFAEDPSEVKAEQENLNLVLDFMNGFLDHYLFNGDALPLQQTHSEKLEIIPFIK